MLFHDPQQSVDRLLCEQGERSADRGFHNRPPLACQTQDHDAGELLGRISVDVGKIEIERNERAMLTSANIDYALVRLTAEFLLDDGMRVIPRSDKQRREGGRKVLVEFAFTQR